MIDVKVVREEKVMTGNESAVRRGIVVVTGRRADPEKEGRRVAHLDVTNVASVKVQSGEHVYLYSSQIKLTTVSYCWLSDLHVNLCDIEEGYLLAVYEATWHLL